MNIKHWRFDLIGLVMAALATRLWHVFQPASVVFDEVYFKVYAGNYLTHSYYFDPHPPLGKLLLGGWAWLTHLDPANLINTDTPSVALRLLPALAGALIVPVFYMFLRQLGATKQTALLGAGLLIVENAIIVESRFILVDSLLILIGLGAVTTMLAARRRPAGNLRTSLIWLAAVLAGLAAAIKWTGLTALALITIIWMIDAYRHVRREQWSWNIVEAAGLIALPLLVYASVFFVHFQLLSSTGQGDAFMSQRFQSTLQGSPYYDPKAKMPFIDKFVELNQEMVRSEESLKTATHPYGSKWYSWPFMVRGVYFWQGATDAQGRQGNIYLIGNPVVWWGMLALIPLSLVVLAGNYQAVFTKHRFALGVLAAGYAMNYLPFSRIVRVMFLYHYFMALLFCLAAMVLLLQIVFEQIARHHGQARATKLQTRTYRALGLTALLAFAYFAPITYGLPQTSADLQSRMWLKTWR